MYASREDPLCRGFEQLPEAGRWAALAHVLDSDDLHMGSTGEETVTTVLRLAPGAPERPATESELREKIDACAGATGHELAALTWDSAVPFLRRMRAP